MPSTIYAVILLERDLPSLNLSRITELETAFPYNGFSYKMPAVTEELDAMSSMRHHSSTARSI